MCPQRDSGFPGTPTRGSWKHHEAAHWTPLLFSSVGPLCGWCCISLFPSQPLSLFDHSAQVCFYSHWMCCIEFISHVPQLRSEWSCSALNFSPFGVCLFGHMGLLIEKQFLSSNSGMASQAFQHETGGSREHIFGGPPLIVNMEAWTTT